jgi:hypothetical protein
VSFPLQCESFACYIPDPEIAHDWPDANHQLQYHWRDLLIMGNNVNCDGAPENVFDRTLLIRLFDRRQFALDFRRSSGLQTGN